MAEPLTDERLNYEPLSREEDDELRRLYFFWMLGMLSGPCAERLASLRARDHRPAIPPPRELGYVLVDQD